ncbi:3-oxoacyl-[acyl-carrier-protein] synthase III C-terminal domain-containing protein [Peredibacter starrii]|uniref:3-oxoacyl-[acyl-carrier-protein] synthase III C-terminal domain-containing protein n=1 Tax=Peredibacter starrii TaxID=28202 RepID=A0AAX4HLF7_9BACT|nr:3-oxoacyl-[acyl-carrier-protein] synthase III C-terminal domain-containing protein [Peredibacter starrii]WPU64061.1 3-oxoacyl-[acyl-carrier-protein] synthase III C-terminal domain-containing protein [Peredibacter starrii]
MEKNVFIHSFASVLPEFHLPQSRIVDWTLESHARSAGDFTDKFKDRLRHFTLTESHIRERYFECGEVDDEWDRHRIYKISEKNPNGSSIEERNHYFGEKAQRVFERLYLDKVPEHLIHVTCTGYVSPSPPQIYFSGKPSAPEITHAYHMGCYASLPSVRMAAAFSHQNETVDVVHTEMCSLHLDASLHTPEQMVVQTLFADGHIKYSVSQKKQGPSLKVLVIQEQLVPDSLSDMTWVPGTHGMMMTLSREVPIKIRDSIPAFVNGLCQKAGVKPNDVLENGIFAIHPGGPKIIEVVQKKLELNDKQVEASKKILFERGNMSSATLPHVWKEILDSRPENGKKILSLAFGPGLTVFGSLFEVSL